jgi:hypothetical protein
MKSKIEIPINALELNRLKDGVMFTWEVKDNNQEWIEVKIRYDKEGKWAPDEY